MLLLGVAVMFSCRFERNNPIDPGAENYVGDESAFDTEGPLLQITKPLDTAVVDTTHVLVEGIAQDNSGIRSVAVNGLNATLDGDYWRVSVAVDVGENALTVTAADNSVHQNTTTARRTVRRQALPSSPSDVSPRIEGTLVVLTWRDNSSNEEGFVVERSDSAGDAFRPVGSTGKDVTTYTDTVPSTGNVRYYYRVFARNQAGASAPSSYDFVRFEPMWFDSTPPVIVSVSPGDGATVIAQPVDIMLEVTDENGVRSVSVAGVDAEHGGGATWSARVALTEGSNTRTIVATDNSIKANQTTLSHTLVYDPAAEDAAPPLITILEPPAGKDTIAHAAPVVRVRVTDQSAIASVKLGDRDMAFAGGSATNAEYTLQLSELPLGPNELVVTAADEPGNTAWDTVHILYDPSIIDETSPRLEVHAPKPNELVEAMSVEVRGAAFDQSGIDRVSVNGVVAAFDGSNSTWSITLDIAHGDNAIEVTARDAAGNDSTFAFSILQNRAPVVASRPSELNAAVQSGDVYSVRINASDPDNDELFFSWLRAPALGTADLDNDGTVSNYSPSVTAKTSDTFSVVVRDVYELSDTVSWFVLVNPPTQVDDPPVWVTVPESAQAFVGTPFETGVTAVDDDALTYGLTAGPEGMLIDQSEGVISWTPPEIGEFEVTVSASGGPQSISHTFVVVVEAGNEPLIFHDTGPFTVDEGVQLKRYFEVEDPGGEGTPGLVGYPRMEPQVNYSPLVQHGGPSKIDPARCSRFTLTWTPTYHEAGHYVLYIGFSNNGTPGRTDTLAVDLTVIDRNAAPRIVSTAPLAAATVNVPYRDTLAVDPVDGDPLFATVANGPSQMTATVLTDNQHVAVSWTPPSSAVGIHDVSIRVNDGAGGEDTLDWQIEVTDGTGPVGSIRTMQNIGKVPKSPAVSIAVSPDGNVLMVGTRYGLFSAEVDVMGWTKESVGMSDDDIGPVCAAADGSVYAAHARNPILRVKKAKATSWTSGGSVNSRIDALLAAPDSSILIGLAGGPYALRLLPSGQPIPYRYNSEPVHSLALGTDQRTFFAGTVVGKVRMGTVDMDTLSGNPLGSSGFSDRVLGLAMSADDILYAFVDKIGLYKLAAGDGDPWTATWKKAGAPGGTIFGLLATNPHTGQTLCATHEQGLFGSMGNDSWQQIATYGKLAGVCWTTRGEVFILGQDGNVFKGIE